MFCGQLSITLFLTITFETRNFTSDVHQFTFCVCGFLCSMWMSLVSYVCVREKVHVRFLPSRDAITWYPLIFLPVECYKLSFIAPLMFFRRIKNSQGVYLYKNPPKNNKGFQYEHKISFLFAVFNWPKKVANQWTWHEGIFIVYQYYMTETWYTWYR